MWERCSGATCPESAHKKQESRQVLGKGPGVNARATEAHDRESVSLPLMSLYEGLRGAVVTHLITVPCQLPCDDRGASPAHSGQEVLCKGERCGFRARDKEPRHLLSSSCG